jgi:hypothetical protein
MIFWMVLFSVAFGAFIALISSEKLKVLISCFSCFLFDAILLVAPVLSINVSSPSDISRSLLLTIIGMLIFPPICFMAMVIFLPINALTKRLTFLLTGLICLLALNEISRHDLLSWLQAPK